MVFRTAWGKWIRPGGLLLVLGLFSWGCGVHGMVRAVEPPTRPMSDFEVVRLVVATDRSAAEPFLPGLTGSLATELGARAKGQRILLAKEVGDPSLLIDVRVKYFHQGKGMGNSATWHLAVRLVEIRTGELIGHFEVRAGSDSLKSGKLAQATTAAAAQVADYLYPDR